MSDEINKTVLNVRNECYAQFQCNCVLHLWMLLIIKVNAIFLYWFIIFIT